ncbi:unnamed protein product [Sphagnum jensenii]|uniref:Uncharacterized protein n=1 Tax=Sphagnum jensenii TaxID=128206 RepID=A0ABP0VI26_9BRYO
MTDANVEVLRSFAENYGNDTLFHILRLSPPQYVSIAKKQGPHLAQNNPAEGPGQFMEHFEPAEGPGQFVGYFHPTEALGSSLAHLDAAEAVEPFAAQHYPVDNPGQFVRLFDPVEAQFETEGDYLLFLADSLTEEGLRPSLGQREALEHLDPEDLEQYLEELDAEAAAGTFRRQFVTAEVHVPFLKQPETEEDPGQFVLMYGGRSKKKKDSVVIGACDVTKLNWRVTARIEKSDQMYENWTQHPVQLREARSSFGAVADSRGNFKRFEGVKRNFYPKGRIFIAGGLDAQKKALASVEMFDTVGGFLNTMLPMHNPTSECQLHIVGDYLFAVGGVTVGFKFSAKGLLCDLDVGLRSNLICHRVLLVAAFPVFKHKISDRTSLKQELSIYDEYFLDIVLMFCCRGSVPLVADEHIQTLRSFALLYGNNTLFNFLRSSPSQIIVLPASSSSPATNLTTEELIETDVEEALGQFLDEVDAKDLEQFGTEEFLTQYMTQPKTVDDLTQYLADSDTEQELGPFFGQLDPPQGLEQVLEHLDTTENVEQILEELDPTSGPEQFLGQPDTEEAPVSVFEEPDPEGAPGQGPFMEQPDPNEAAGQVTGKLDPSEGSEVMAQPEDEEGPGPFLFVHGSKSRANQQASFCPIASCDVTIFNWRQCFMRGTPLRNGFVQILGGVEDESNVTKENVTLNLRDGVSEVSRSQFLQRRYEFVQILRFRFHDINANVRSSFQTIVVNGFAYAIGGFISPKSVTAKIEKSDQMFENWTQHPAQLLEARSSFGAAADSQEGHFSDLDIGLLLPINCHGVLLVAAFPTFRDKIRNIRSLKQELSVYDEYFIETVLLFCSTGSVDTTTDVNVELLRRFAENYDSETGEVSGPLLGQPEARENPGPYLTQHDPSECLGQFFGYFDIEPGPELKLPLFRCQPVT